MRKTKDLLLGYESCPDEAKHSIAEKYLKDIDNSNYMDDYVAVNKHKGKDLLPEINKLVLLAEERAFDIQQVDYADRFTVFNRLNEITLGEGIEDMNKEVSFILSKIDKEKTLRKKLQLICTMDISSSIIHSILDSMPENIKTSYLILGPERCRALGYDLTKLKIELDSMKLENSSEQLNSIYSTFEIGKMYPLPYIKSQLKQIYEKVGNKKTAKATDLNKWFEIRQTSIREKQSDGTDKKIIVFEILKKL